MRRIAIIALVGSLLTGCQTPPSEIMPQHSAIAGLMVESGVYFTILKKAGVLPDIGKDDHAKFQTVPTFADPSQTAIYPFTSKLAVITDGKDQVYWYIMEKTNETADWRVVKIWKTDKNNSLLADNLPLPTTSAETDANVESGKWRHSRQGTAPTAAGAASVER